VIDVIPSGRSDETLATLIPGVPIAGAISPDVGGIIDQMSSQLAVQFFPRPSACVQGRHAEIRPTSTATARRP